MKLEIKDNRHKEPSVYKTLYIKNSLAKKIEAIAKDNNTSWTNAVVSILENCVKDYD